MKKRIRAEIIDIIHCKQHISFDRDYTAEIRADYESIYSYPRDKWYSDYAFDSLENENNYIDFAERHKGYSAIRNEWSGEFELYNKVITYENRIRIRYRIANVTYENIIDLISWKKDIDSIIIVVDKRAPNNILYISFI